jgi:AcrR family transcriptional regulator
MDTAPARKSRPRPPGRVSKSAWLAAAYEVLVKSGLDAVKVMPLAQKLKVSRTSFYWHFEDRDTLLDAILGLWEDKNTGNLVRRTEAYAETITEAMFNLFDCWLDDGLFDARLDRAIRAWAHRDPAVQARIDRADTVRKAAIMAMFARFGYPRPEAEVRAMTVLYTQVGYISMRINEPFADRIARMPDYAEVFTGRAPSEAEKRRFRARHADRFGDQADQAPAA